MRLTSVQVTLLKQAENEYRGDVASRGCHVHTAMEKFAEAILRILGINPYDLDRLTDRE